MQRLFDRRVFLRLWVKVRDNWSDDEAALQRWIHGVEVRSAAGAAL
jgi:GTP-binding protein Era